MGEQNDDTKEKVTPPAPSADKKTDPNDPNSSGGSDVTDKDKKGGDKEPMIPKHRFDEVAEKARLGEQAMKDLQELKGRFDNMADAMGGKKAGQEMSDEVKSLADKYGLKDDFIKDMLSVSTARAKRELQEELKPLKAQQAQAYLNNEFAALERDVPDAKDLSKEDRDELTKMAIEPRYRNVPLVDLWKIKNFGKPAGKTKTAEPSRGGAQKADDGEVDIKNMSLTEFETYSNNLAKKK